ncbi:MAG: metallophosphoesterase [Lachnospiraceae bacterium]|nr:metallophosphoesterase [Lachnospiraceae bacterium]
MRILNFVKKNNKKIIILFSFITVILIFFWYQNNHIVIDVYDYKSSKISDNTEKFSIVQISDLHNACFGKNNKNLVGDIESLEPDIIVITGDIVDSNHTDIGVAIDFVRQMTERYPVYYVTGNHEYWLDEGQRRELFTGIKDAGAVILNNEKITIDVGTDSITLIGLDDNSLRDATLNSIMETCDKNELTVVLAHEPQYLDKYCDAGADLVLTGHAHGGQMILPFIGPLIAPDQGFFPTYTAGQFQKESTTMYISRGLGNSVIPVRLFNYPEIVCVEICGIR